MLQQFHIHISVVNNDEVIALVYEQTGGRLYIFDITEKLFLVKENKDTWSKRFVSSISSCGDKIVKTGINFGGNAATLTDRMGEECWSRIKSNDGQYLFDLPQFSICYLENNKLVIVIADTMKNTITKLDGETGEILNIISDESPFGVAVDADRGVLFVCKRYTSQVVAYTTDLDNSRILLTYVDGQCRMPRYITFNSSNKQLLISSESFNGENYLDCFQINYE